MEVQTLRLNNHLKSTFEKLQSSKEDDTSMKLNPWFKPILVKRESNDPLEIKLFLITSLLFFNFNIVYWTWLAW